jgi:hypothetical protein
VSIAETRTPLETPKSSRRLSVLRSDEVPRGKSAAAREIKAQIRRCRERAYSAIPVGAPLTDGQTVKSRASESLWRPTIWALIPGLRPPFMAPMTNLPSGLP